MPDLRSTLESILGSTYRISRELTGGGMSRVFLAEETALEREVVIKVLAPDLVEPSHVERFRIEVLQTARLQHPSIVPVLAVGTVPDSLGRPVPYYVMPYVRGESLRSRMEREGRFSLSGSVRVLRELLEALVHAHSHGIVHRDIKPENIFLSGGHAILADLGVLKAMKKGPAAAPSITSPGMAVGTPTYMAPEQAAGEEATDHRADLYSVGAVGYEMLAGRVPFPGRTSVEIVASQARGRFAPLRAQRPDAPQELVDTIERCLAWEPERRWQSAGEMLRVVESLPTSDSGVRATRPGTLLRWYGRRGVQLGAAAAAVLVALTLWLTLGAGNRVAAASQIDLAVLHPTFEGDGTLDTTVLERIHEHIVNDLRPVSGLNLSGIMSVDRLSGLGIGSRDIAESLGVDHTVTLAVRQEQDGTHRLLVQLLRRNDSTAHAVGDPLVLSGLQTIPIDSLESISRRIAGRLVAGAGLIPRHSHARETEVSEAYVEWSLGRKAYARRTARGIAEAVGHFRRAIALDSVYAQAHAELATVLAHTVFYGYRLEGSAYERMGLALAHAERAVALDQNLAEGFVARAYITNLAGGPLASIRADFQRALSLRPGSPYVNQWYATLLMREGREAEALDLVKSEGRRDPYSPSRRVAIAIDALPIGQYDLVVREARRGRELEPNLVLAAALEVWGLLLLDRPADCERIPLGPYLGTRALCLERLGRTAEADAVADSLQRILLGRAPMDPVFDESVYQQEMALYYGAKQNAAAAGQWLRFVFRDSPLGIERRLLASGFFAPELVQEGERLRAAVWPRLQAARDRAMR